MKILSRFSFSIAVSAALGLAMPWSAAAHQDPPGCNGIDASVGFIQVRANDLAISGTVSECETIKYQAKLSWVSNCLIQDGTFELITPDGVAHVVSADVPCLGVATQDAEGCVVGQDTFIESAFIEYTVDPNDIVGGQVSATAVWSNGILHSVPGNDSPQQGERTLSAVVEFCGDDLFCNGVEFCDPAAVDGTGRVGVCVDGPDPDCGTPDGCVDRFCDENLDACVENDLSDACGTDDGCFERFCDPAIGTDPGVSGCVENDLTGQCGVSDGCAERGCDPAIGTTPGVSGCFVNDTSGGCGADDGCVERGCDPSQPPGQGCFSNDLSANCGTDDGCFERFCNPAIGTTPGVSGCVENDLSGNCPASTFCFERDCDPAIGTDPGVSGCTETDVSDKCNLDPAIPDVCELCVDDPGECIVDLTQDPTCIPSDIICRTPGFWGTHGGTEKNRSQNITQAVIDSAGGCLEVCGEVVTNTDVDDAESALEAICVSPRGDQSQQLVRQMTAMALNCVVSQVGATCGGNAGLSELWDDCTAACLGNASTRSIGECVGDVDCFNNGGTINASGECVFDGLDNCHERVLPDPFHPPGPAGSPHACRDSRQTDCQLQGPNETACASGLQNAGGELCVP
jgi:hypothetical protein